MNLGHGAIDPPLGSHHTPLRDKLIFQHHQILFLFFHMFQYLPKL